MSKEAICGIKTSIERKDPQCSAALLHVLPKHLVCCFSALGSWTPQLRFQTTMVMVPIRGTTNHVRSVDDSLYMLTGLLRTGRLAISEGANGRFPSISQCWIGCSHLLLSCMVLSLATRGVGLCVIEVMRGSRAQEMALVSSVSGSLDIESFELLQGLCLKSLQMLEFVWGLGQIVQVRTAPSWCFPEKTHKLTSRVLRFGCYVFSCARLLFSFFVASCRLSAKHGQENPAALECQAQGPR